MAIQRPHIDLPEFDELVTESRTQLPRLAPQWTDHNAHDPGITLIELLAWLTETGLYRTQRITKAHHRAFARRLGLESHRPRSAQTVVQLSAETSTAIPADTELHSINSEVVFSTDTNLFVRTDAADPVLVGENKVIVGWQDNSLCLPFGHTPTTGDWFELLFDEPLDHRSGRETSLYIYSGTQDHDRQTIAALKQWADTVQCTDQQWWWVHYSAQLVWETLTNDDTWVETDVLLDETRALTLSGLLRLRPSQPHHGRDGKFPLRCRIAKGGYDCPPTIERVMVNAVRASHRSALKPAGPPSPASTTPFWVIGQSSGQASERYFLPDLPVTFEDLEVRLLAGDLATTPSEPLPFKLEAAPSIGEPYTAVAFWDRTQAHDRHVLLDPQDGVLTFGNGRIGWVPAAGTWIAVRYRTGGGLEGNVAANTLVHAKASQEMPLGVVQPFGATGGTAAESNKDLRARLLAKRNRLHRAVSLEDFESLALGAPGLPVERAWAIAEHHPEHPCLVATGCVTLVIVPPCPDAQPMPSPALLQAIAQYLEPRRTLTTQLHVVAPQYRPIAIAARLHVRDATQHEQLQDQATKAFNELIHPLRGGPEKTGWRPGRDLHHTEVLALLMALDGVTAIDQFAFIVNGQRNHCPCVALCQQAFFSAADHSFEIIQENPHGSH